MSCCVQSANEQSRNASNTVRSAQSNIEHSNGDRSICTQNNRHLFTSQSPHRRTRGNVSVCFGPGRHVCGVTKARGGRGVGEQDQGKRLGYHHHHHHHYYHHHYHHQHHHHYYHYHHHHHHHHHHDHYLSIAEAAVALFQSVLMLF